MQGISWLVEELLASEEEPCFLDSYVIDVQWKYVLSLTSIIIIMYRHCIE